MGSSISSVSVIQGLEIVCSSKVEALADLVKLCKDASESLKACLRRISAVLEYGYD